MQDHVLDRGQGQGPVTLEPDRPVPDEAAAGAVIAGQMVLRRRLPQPKSVVSGGAGAANPGIVPDCGYELGRAPGQDKHAPPKLLHSGVGQAGSVSAGKAGE